jgi:hypothetical protein
MSSFMISGHGGCLVEPSRSSFALVISYLCAGEDLPPPSGDADEGCQWEVQTDEG